MTVRNLPVEASTIWQEQGQVFAFSRPVINDARDAASFQHLVHSRLTSLSTDRVLTAEVTFELPLTLPEVESLIGGHNLVSLLSIAEDGSTGRTAYPPEEVPDSVEESFSAVFESLSRGTPAPDLNPGSFIAAEVRADVSLLRALALEPRVFSVDVGPVDLENDFPGGMFTALKDVSFDYRTHVGALCSFEDLSERVDTLFSNGEIKEPELKDAMQNALTEAQAALDSGDREGAGRAMAAFFDAFAVTSAEAQRLRLTEGVEQELTVAGECLVAVHALLAFPEWLPPLSLAEPYQVRLNATIPVKFTVLDLRGDFVHSRVVSVALVDTEGEIVVGPVGFSSSPSTGVAVTGRQYHHNLRTRGLSPGTYFVRVTLESAKNGGVAFRQIELAAER